MRNHCAWHFPKMHHISGQGEQRIGEENVSTGPNLLFPNHKAAWHNVRIALFSRRCEGLKKREDMENNTINSFTPTRESLLKNAF